MADGMHLMIPASEYAEMESKIERLEKALDKACAYLHFGLRNINYHLPDNAGNISERRVPVMTEEEWKEWCMNNAD